MVVAPTPAVSFLWCASQVQQPAPFICVQYICAHISAHAELHTHVFALLFLTRLKNRSISPDKPKNVYLLVHSIFMCASKSVWYRSGVICYTEYRENVNLLRVVIVHINKRICNIACV